MKKLKISEFFQSPFNVFLFRHLSPTLAQRYLHTVGALYYALKPREKRLIEKNVREVLAGQPEAEVRRVVRETFKGIFTHYFEKMFSAFLDYETVHRYVEDRFEVKGAEVIARALEAGKGCILVTAHWGAVEFIPWVLHKEGLPTSVILECATARLARGLQQKIAGRDMQLLTSGHGQSIYLRAMQALKDNRVLMTQCDEVDAWRRRRSHTISLFGRELFFDSTIDVLSHRSGAPVVAAFLKRTGRNRYTLYCEDVSVQRQTDSTSRDCLALWEKYVLESPEQWYQWKKWGAMKVA